jgi:putative ABC transport system ATP-binding protein
MIELNNVSRTVPSGAGPLTILHPTSCFESAAGRVVAVTGPSGSGKSTLLGLIAGLDAPTTGTITVDGVNITAQSEESLARLRGARIGIVFQFFHLLPSLTAFENILVPMEIAGAPDAERAPHGCCTTWAWTTGGITIRPSCRRRAAARRHRTGAVEQSARPARR